MALRVLVCGGGALAHVFAGVIGAVPGTRVSVLTRRPAEWSHSIAVHHADLVIQGKAEATDDPAVAADAVLILVAAPAFAHEAILRRLLPHLQPDTWVGALPAIGGFDLLLRHLAPGHGKVLGSLRAPYNARVLRYGHEVLVTGVVPHLDLVIGSGGDRHDASALLEDALALPLRVIEPFLLATLSPASTIFHAARMFELLIESKPKRQKFYAGWGDAAGRCYLAMDAELAALRRILQCDAPGIDAAGHYGVFEPAALAHRIRSLPGLPDIDAPVFDGMLDVEHRFVREDIPYGLNLAQLLASKVGLPCPAMTSVLATITQAAGPAAASLIALPSHFRFFETGDGTIT